MGEYGVLYIRSLVCIHSKEKCKIFQISFSFRCAFMVRRQKEVLAVCNRMFNYLQSCIPFKALVVQLKLTQAMKPINTGINWNSYEQFQHLSCYLPLQSGVLLCQKDSSPQVPMKQNISTLWRNSCSLHHIATEFGSSAVCLDLSKSILVNPECFLSPKKITFMHKTASYMKSCALLY